MEAKPSPERGTVNPMGRVSNRRQLLEAAIRVAENHGLQAVTLDSVAAEAGLTKAGLLYHFPGRRELLVAVYAHLAAEWEADMVAELGGGDPETASPRDRLRAYIKVSSRPMSKAELVYLADARDDRELIEPWREVADRWIPPFDEMASRPEVMVACLAADGLWIHDVLSGRILPEGMREVLVDWLLGLVDQ